ncbi:MAG: transposase, partial [Candidatus Altiarchaeota archaeon]|nr:transposase [Candidatus Altiarchaeota archaeon]
RSPYSIYCKLPAPKGAGVFSPTYPSTLLAQAHFKCLECGYEANSDFNASVNIVKVFREKAPTQPTWLGGRGELNRP